MIRPDPATIRQRHLSKEVLDGKTMYDGHVLVDLADLCDEVDRLRARSKWFENEAEAREIEMLNRVEISEIVIWMREMAEIYASNSDLVGGGYAVTWHIIADLIEKRAWEDP